MQKNKKSKWRRIRTKIKNFSLKTTAVIMGVTFIISACALDYDSWIPYIVCCISAGWLALFAYANGCMYDYYTEEGEEYVQNR